METHESDILIPQDDVVWKSGVPQNFEEGFGALAWNLGNGIPWTVTSLVSCSGTRSAQAGTIASDEQTTLTIRLDCEAGKISFWRKVSSETVCDYLEFFIDGQSQGQWSGELDWEEVTFPVQAGKRTFTWTYSKDDSSSRGQDTAWIDDITFPAQ